ncbi:MAG TPA: YfbU family protein [Verrucomicrobiae bacterium]|nr:YfbU family protein [Verrucomicrobiae bacterium]
MGQITITLPDQLEMETRYAAERSHATVSDYVRDALRNQLKSGQHLPFWDRALLTRILQIHEAVTKQDSSDTVEALQDGYTISYKTGFQDIRRDEVSESVTDFVRRVLDMHSFLQASADKIGDSELLKRVTFEGFDGNNEHEYLGYTHFLDKRRQWAYVRGMNPCRNSHASMVHIYTRMLEKWEAMLPSLGFEANSLSREQIEVVLDARRHPSNQ